MAPPRLAHTPGKTYYVILNSNEGRKLFSHAEDFVAFAALAEKTVRGSPQLKIHAFCWVPDEIHFVVQVGKVPLGRFIQKLAGQYARNVNRKLGLRGHLFQERYEATPLDGTLDVLNAVRHAHLLPVSVGLTDDPTGYAWSSHHAYLGYIKIPWLTTSTVMRELNVMAPDRDDAYRLYIRAELVDAAKRSDSPDLQMKLESLRRRRRRDPALLDRIVRSVEQRLDIPKEAMLSPSRRRSLSLARALVAWHATNNEIATLTQVAQYFHRNTSTLCVGVERYRRTRHDLFNEPIPNLLESSTSPASEPAVPSKAELT